MIAAESYGQLMTNAPHIEFEVTLTLVQDVLIGMVLWPLAKRIVRRHDAQHHAHQPVREVVESGNVRVLHAVAASSDER